MQHFKLIRYRALSIVFFSGMLGGGLVSTVCADWTPEQKHRVRGEMREAWQRMTPEEREALQREHDGQATTLTLSGQPLTPPPRAGRPVVDVLMSPPPEPIRQNGAGRPMTPEDHFSLRRQLRDMPMQR